MIVTNNLILDFTHVQIWFATDENQAQQIDRTLKNHSND